MNYEQFSLEKLNELTCAYMLLHRDTGGTHESDTSINDISRAMVRKYHEKTGCCFLGKYNQPERLINGEKAKLIPYEGQRIFNFEFDFAVPHMDEYLLELLTEQNTPHGAFDSQKTCTRINAITTRVSEICGIFLLWT